MIDFEYAEGATPLDPDEIDGLLLTHITTMGELDRWEQDNILRALAWLAKTKPNDILNEAFIKRLHQHMLGDVWRWAGKLRLRDKNIGIPWWRISADLKALFDDVEWWIGEEVYTSDEKAVRFHHRLVSIHSFHNGNGRHARLMADLLNENLLGTPRFSWGGRDLVKMSDTRREYIEALRSADQSDYDPLMKFSRS